MSDNRIENTVEHTLFVGRWLMTPFYLGLIFGIGLLLVKFGQEIIHLSYGIVDISESRVILGVLALVDVTLVANLLLIVAFVGYHHFVSRLGDADHKDHPTWLEKIDYSGLKIKAMGSVAAIAGIQLLRVFIDIKQYSESEVYLMIFILLAVAVSGVLLAVMDKIAHSYTEL